MVRGLLKAQKLVMRPLRFRGALKGIWRPPGGYLSAFGGLLGDFSGRLESSVERPETLEGDWRSLGGLGVLGIVLGAILKLSEGLLETM